MAAIASSATSANERQLERRILGKMERWKDGNVGNVGNVGKAGKGNMEKAEGLKDPGSN